MHLVMPFHLGRISKGGAMRAAIWFVGMILCGTAPAVAGPDQTTQKLINDPVSMLDLGVFKADLALSRRELGFMNFSWDSNRFTISTYKLGGFADAQAAESACASWIAEVRELGGLDTKTGKPFGPHSWFAQNFSHEGFERVGTSETLYSDLDRLFDLNCTAIAGADTVVVTAALLGTTYSLRKNPEK